MILMKRSELENPFAVIFVLVDWAGGQYEIDFLKKCWFGDGSCFSKIIVPSAGGVGVGKWHFCDHPKKVRGQK